jgi:RNA polymerase sigma factor (sigma-70 family)
LQQEGRRSAALRKIVDEIAALRPTQDGKASNGGGADRMTTARLDRVVQRLRTLAGGGDLTDGMLLETFVRRKDEAAFAELVRRHGPMVMGVCRRILGNEPDADDAFQATFLVLVRRAHVVRPRGLVGNWLYGVACRTAREARRAAAKRRLKEAKAMPRPEPAEQVWEELRPLLDQELARLPDRYRAPVVLCDLEGKTRKEAALQLGWPEGTLHSRLSRGRAMLARRLTRRGLGLSAGAAAVVIAGGARAACVAPALGLSTIRAAMAVAAGNAAVGAASAKAAALTEGVMKAMLLTRLKILTAVLLALTAAGIGAGVFTSRLNAQTPPPRAKAAPVARDAAGAVEAPVPDEKPLADAVRAFNQRAADNPVGKDQPPLTEDEVIAAMRWTLLGHDDVLLADDTLQALRVAVETRKLPPEFLLEEASGYEPNDQVVFTAWSVRLRVPSAKGGTTCIRVRDRWIGSRVIGPEERKVIHKWQDKERAQGGVGSLERVEWMKEYWKERNEAIEKDRAAKP